MSESAFPIVGLGASAGGIEAFHHFFKQLPADCGMAIVLLLHLPPRRVSLLGEIISRWTTLPVCVVSEGEGESLAPNRVYVPDPGSLVSVRDGRLEVHRAPEDGQRLLRPIDAFFDSLATDVGHRAVGIVLSGMDGDGALGLKAISERGGLTLAQGVNGTEPQFGDMPAHAIATGAVDIIAPVEDIPGHLLRLRASEARGTTTPESSSDAERLEICAILRSRLGHDFSEYRAQTFMRRVQRRMQVVGVPTLAAYIGKLSSDPSEVTLLFQDLLIRVTSFFRDEDIFHTLATQVIPALFHDKMADGAVRVWVPGCATGEEAYSLAILLREHMDSLPACPKVQVFATDIDEASIGTARLGRYPKTLVEGLSEQRRQRFFSPSHGVYCVTKEIRELCTFSVHNLVRDPPFSMLSLISCRNLLIYMNPTLQSRVIPTFHYSLMPGGVLLLGSSESVAQHPALFEAIDKSARIFRRREGPSPELNLTWRRTSVWPPSLSAANQRSNSSSAARVTRSDVPAVTRGVGLPLSGFSVPDRFQHLIGQPEATPEVVRELQHALLDSAEELRSLAEEHQTALEELRSINEELHSVNEEVQSANEELETSKEELQSLNEELHTVNVRLTEKIDELDHTNSDLRNLFASTEIATLFLDRHLLIRSFTPAIAGLYNLIPSDEGRPLTDIAGRLQYPSLRQDVESVLRTLEPLERRVVRDDGAAHYILRMLPYREPDSSVSGVLLTFIDVSSIVQAEEALVEADVRKDVFLATLSHELRNPLAPIRIAAQLLGAPTLKPQELQKAQAIIVRQVAHMSSLLEDLLDVSRITRGAFLLKKEYVAVQVLLDGAVEAVRPALDAKSHTLRIESIQEPVTLEVDPLRITQAITNLLTNAAKYTPAGGVIHLATRLDKQHFCIVVRDNGIGLTATAMSKVFDMFTRIKTDGLASEGGLGIGLALAKGFVELHGGRLTVQSAGIGKGSEFAILIPRSLVVNAESESFAEPKASAPAARRRILIADDNRDGTDAMRMLLESRGHEVHVANSGTEALECARRVRPEVALLDIGMPDLSGYEVAAQLRAEAWGRKIKLIAITGWGQEADRRRALAAGFDRHMTKPVDPIELGSLFATTEAPKRP